MGEFQQTEVTNRLTEFFVRRAFSIASTESNAQVHKFRNDHSLLIMKDVDFILQVATEANFIAGFGAALDLLEKLEIPAFELKEVFDKIRITL